MASLMSRDVTGLRSESARACLACRDPDELFQNKSFTDIVTVMIENLLQ